MYQSAAVSHGISCVPLQSRLHLSAFSKHLLISIPTACATGGGKALPIILQAIVFLLPKVHVSGKPWMRAIIRLVRRGIPSKSCSGASFAIPFPSTPSSAHAFFALVGPRSGPPCFLEPPTSVGAILSAPSAHFFAPFHPFCDIRSHSVSPTVGDSLGCSCGYSNAPA